MTPELCMDCDGPRVGPSPGPTSTGRSAIPPAVIRARPRDRAKRETGKKRRGMRKTVETAGLAHMASMREHFRETGVDLSSSGFLSGPGPLDLPRAGLMLFRE
eukprot:CAMPEP_0205943336 /NCGR_PEP_ID=MMETSP1325-20131115/60166_1 /ASSEMBLY_ACC=CAM_ASM_000708 /TAXON_ID=236786 /ORGANISM="Florenciella sp., Strain RCC1007" /LENGTH=102 /DNA_ID=CAMNT_0053314135 /DNA_START=83 /DNA_END=388 /DNA_ORIENTATION=-